MIYGNDPVVKAKRRSLLVSVGISTVCVSAVADTTPIALLASVVDTLLPADDVSPPASALGKDQGHGQRRGRKLYVDAVVRCPATLDGQSCISASLRPYASQQVQVLSFTGSVDFNEIP